MLGRSMEVWWSTFKSLWIGQKTKPCSSKIYRLESTLRLGFININHYKIIHYCEHPSPWLWKLLCDLLPANTCMHPHRDIEWGKHFNLISIMCFCPFERIIKSVQSTSKCDITHAPLPTLGWHDQNLVLRYVCASLINISNDFLITKARQSMAVYNTL